MTPDRLQARIRAQLELPVPDLETHLLATEHAALAARTRERLEQAATLVRLGNEQAALQAAEAEPPLLDLCAWLGFAEVERWNRLCRERGLPVAPALDDEAIAAVEQLYGKPIDETHPLYRDYRQAMRERDDARALVVLRAIARLNPGDVNAQAELGRLGLKFARETLAKVRARLAAGDMEGADRLAAEIERLGAAGLAGDPEWEDALERRRRWHAAAARERLGSGIARAVREHAAGEVRACAAEVAAARTLERTSGERAEGDDAARLAAAEAWAGARLAEEQAEFAGRAEAETLTAELAALRAALGTGADGAALRRAGTWLERARLVAERLDPAATDEVRALREEAHRRVNRRHTFRVALSLAALLGTLWLGYRYLSDLRAEGTTTAALARAEEAILAGDADAAMDILRVLPDGHEASADGLRRRLDKLREDGQALAREAEQLRALGLDGVTRLNHAEVRRRAAALRAAADRLAPAARTRLLEQAGDLAALVAAADKVRSTIEPEIEGWMRELEAAAGRGERLVDPEAAERLVARLREQLAGPEATDDVPAELADRGLALAERVHERLTQERRSREDGERLAAATDLTGYVEALRQLAAARPETAMSRAAAKALGSSGTLGNLPRSLLAPRAGEMWDALPEAPPEPSLDAGDAAEVALLLQDKSTRDFTRFIVRRHGVGDRRSEPVIVSGPVSREVRSFPNGNETVAVANLLRSSGDIVSSTWKLITFDNGTLNGEELVPALPLPEVDYQRRLSRVMDATTGRPREPLLQVAERVRRETGSPILRAYHLQELLKLAARKPAASGLAFSPAAQGDARELRGITQNAIGPTDFLFPDRWKEERRAIERLLAAPAAPYPEESRHLRALLARVRDGGIRLVGRVGLSGEPDLREESGTAAFLGIDTSGQVGVLFRGDGAGGLRRLREPMPLTPLLRLGRSPEEAASDLGEPPRGIARPKRGWDALLEGTDL